MDENTRNNGHEAEQEKKNDIGLEGFDLENSTIFTDKPSQQSKMPKKKAKNYTDENGKTQVKHSNPYLKGGIVLLCTATLITASIFGIMAAYPEGSKNSGAEQTTTSALSNNTNLTKSANVALADMKNVPTDAFCNVKSIVIENENGKLEAYASELVKAEDESGTDTVNFAIKGHDDLPINASLVNSLYEHLFEVYASSKLSDEWSDADCGLDKPRVKVNATMADGSTFWFQLGNEVPDGLGSYYGNCSLTDGIYIITSETYESYSKQLTDLIELTMFEPFESDDSNKEYFSDGKIIEYEHVTIGGSRLDDPIELSYNDESNDTLIYHIESPCNTYADDEQIAKLLAPLTDGFSSLGAYVVNPTDKQLEEYGLKEPSTVLTYKVLGKTITLNFSKSGVKDEGYYACTVNDVPVIYQVLASNYEFIEWTTDDLRFSLMFVKNIESVQSVRFQSGDSDETYKVQYVEKVADTQSQTTAANGATATTAVAETELVVIHNAEKVTAEYFQAVYQEIVLLKASKHLEKGETAITENPYLTITFTYNNGDNPSVIRLSKYNDRFYSYSIDGIGDELIRYDDVEKLAGHIADLNAGKEVVSPVN